MRTEIDSDEVVSILIDFEEWLMKSTCSSTRFVADALRVRSVQASDNQIRRIASDLEEMACSVVDDAESWVADLLRRNGIAVNPLPAPETTTPNVTQERLF